MSETILVVGATGMLGEPVARRLAESGHNVRVMSRSISRAKSLFDDSKFQIVQGDVEDEESLRKAMEGCTCVHLSLSGNGEQRGAEVASKVASETPGMKRISIITGATTCQENAWFPSTKAKYQAEQALKKCGVPYTIFRCTMFMESLPKWRAVIVGKQDTLWHWVAAKDYANMVANAYNSFEASADKTFYVYGPETLTMEQALKIFIPTCAPEATIEYMPFWKARLVSWLPGNEYLRDVVLPWMNYFEKVRELGNEEDIEKANTALGSPTVTVKDWCEAYSANHSSK